MEHAFALRIVGLGDSTTAGTPGFLSPVEAPPNGYGNKESQYAYWMMKEHRDWNVLNRGVNGERSDQVLARFEQDVIKEEPDIVIILAGVNDIFQGAPVDNLERNLSKMYSLASGAMIDTVSCSVLPYNIIGKREARVRIEVNEWIRSESSKLGLAFCDTAAAVSSPGNPDMLASTPDGLHPDVQGYRKMAMTLAETIEVRIRKRR